MFHYLFYISLSFLLIFINTYIEENNIPFHIFSLSLKIIINRGDNVTCSKLNT